MGKKLRRWFMKKFYGKEFFYADPSIGTEFYMGVTAYYDMTILMIDVNANTMREFLVDFNTLREIYLFAKEGIINPFPANDRVEKPVHIAKSYVTKDGFRVIASNDTKMYGSVILGKVMNIMREADKDEAVLSLKRIAYLPVNNNHVLGIDTMAIPVSAAIDMMQLVKKRFKDVDIETDLLKGGQDAINQNNGE
jgi:hypothetical protein